MWPAGFFFLESRFLFRTDRKGFPTLSIFHWYTGRWDIQDTVINLILGRTIVEFVVMIYDL